MRRQQQLPMQWISSSSGYVHSVVYDACIARHEPTLNALVQLPECRSQLLRYSILPKIIALQLLHLCVSFT